MSDAPTAPPTPLVTIGITCFNAEASIERAVTSALAQEWPTLEIVVVDDASTDGSWPVLQRLAAGEPRLTAIRHEKNRGFPGALNSIVGAARGEFIAFFDDDDESARRRIRVQVSRLTEYEREHSTDYVLCYSGRRVVHAEKDRANRIARPIGHAAPEPHGPIVADYLFGLNEDSRFVWGMFGSGTMLARRATLLRVGPFDERFRRCAEWDMAVRAAFDGAHFIGVAEPLMTQHKTATSDKANQLPLKYALLLRHKYKDYLKSRHGYWYSVAFAHAKHHYARGDRMRFRLAILWSFLLRPQTVWRQWTAARRAPSTGH